MYKRLGILFLLVHSFEVAKFISEDRLENIRREHISRIIDAKLIDICCRQYNHIKQQVRNMLIMY